MRKAFQLTDSDDRRTRSTTASYLEGPTFRNSKSLAMRQTKVEARRKQEADHSLNEIERFERKQYDRRAIGLEDFTKQELIKLIEENGWEMPGKTFYDEETGRVVREPCSKQEYLEVCKAQYTSVSQGHLVRRGGVISGHECIISLHRARRGGVRIGVYNQHRSEDYEIVLSKFRLQELNLPSAPDKDADWQSWSRLITERLQISSEDNQLFVGPPPLQANGLPKKFALVDEDSLTQYQRGSRTSGANNMKAARLNVRMFFEMM